MADIFDEVNEDLRAERAKQFALRYGWIVALAAALLIAGAGAWQGWRYYQARGQSGVASAYLGAMRAATPPDAALTPDATPAPARAAAMAEFDRLAETGPEGYRSLARLRSAALHASQGDLPGALALWDRLAADTAADPLLRDLASLLWVQRQVDAGDPAAIEGRLQPLLAAGNPWRHLALESQAWLALRAGRADQARETLRKLAADAAAPEGVRGRANGLLTQLGDAADAVPQPSPGPTAKDMGVEDMGVKGNGG